MGKEQWQTVLILVAILVAGFFLQSDAEDVSGEAVRRSLSQAPVQIQTAPVHTCGYQNIDRQFSQRLGSLMPLQIIEFLKLINDRYLALVALDTSTNIPGLYVYDIGADRRFDTSDDKGFLVDLPSAYDVSLDFITSSTGTTTLYWTGFFMQSFLKQCTITSQGCTPTTLISLPYGSTYIRSIITSPSTNELYFASQPFQGTAYILSCSLQLGLANSCTNGLNAFTIHQQIPLISGGSASTFTYYGIHDLGFFISGDPWSTASPSHFLVNLLQPTTYITLQGTFFPSALNFIPGQNILVFAVQNTPSGTGNAGNSQVVLIDSLSGAITPSETLNANIMTIPFSIQFVGSQIVTLYHEMYNPLLMGKRLGSPAVQIGTSTSMSFYSAITLPDLTVLGLTSSRNLLRFDCTP